MSPEDLVLHLTPPPGVTPKPYPPWRDQVYRVALTVAAGALILRGAALAAGAPTLVTADLALLAASTLSAAYFFLVWIERYRTLVIGVAVLGSLVLIGSAALGVGLLMAASSIMAAKETHCFRFPTGRVIPWASLVVALAGLVPGLHTAYAAGLAAVGLLWAPLLWSRFKMRLLAVSAP
ncbi:MAG: hypothetical protein ACP5QO_12380 [Clostridia bacterium]